MSKGAGGYTSNSAPDPFFIPLITTLPTTAAEGQIYIQTSDNTLYYYNGSAWKKPVNSPIVTADITDGSITPVKLSSGVVLAYGIFNGTDGSSIAAFNCTAVRNGTGDYTVTVTSFTGVPAYTSLIPVITPSVNGGTLCFGCTQAQTTTTIRLNTVAAGGSLTDRNFCIYIMYA